MGRMYSNVNAKFRTFNTGSAKSIFQLRANLPTPKERSETEAFQKKRKKEAEQEEQKRLIEMRHTTYAAKKLVKSKDKRRRRRLSKKGFKGARKLKLTRTAKMKRKVP